MSLLPEIREASHYYRDMIKFKNWYHMTISYMLQGRYITEYSSEKWCQANCEGEWHRGYYMESDGLYEAVYFKLEEDRFKFILWM